MNKIYKCINMDYKQLETEIAKIDRKIEDLKSQKRLLRKLQSAEQAKESGDGNREVYG